MNIYFVTKDEKGYRRIRNEKGFQYINLKEKIIKNKKELARIKSLKIPPGYHKVWICSKQNGPKVCKSSYIHPALLQQTVLTKLEKLTKPKSSNQRFLSPIEVQLLDLLK